MNDELIKWIREMIKYNEEWIDYLNATNQYDSVAFYAGTRQGLRDVLERLGQDLEEDEQ